LNSDSKAILGIATIALLILALLSDASFKLTGLTIGFIVAATWVYIKFFQPKQPQSKATISDQELREIRGQSFQDVADSLPRAIVVLDRNADVIYANGLAFELLSPDIIGKPIGAYLRTSSVRSYMERAFRGETPPSLSVHVVVFAVLADRTQARIEGEQRADFLANASHELKTPIASMSGFIETLRGHAKDDPIAREKFLKIMAEQAERMERLVTDLLSLRRIESSQHLAPSETADLRKAVVAARDALTLLAEDKGVTLSISLPNEDAALTGGKTDECVQLFLNLMENGIKLSPSGSTLQVSLERLPQWTGQAFKGPINPETSSRRIVNLAPTEHPVWRRHGARASHCQTSCYAPPRWIICKNKAYRRDRDNLPRDIFFCHLHRT